MQDLQQARICVEKILPKDQAYFNSIHHPSHSIDYIKKSRAAFINAKLWPIESKIRIGFLTKPRSVTWTPINVLEQSGKQLDPLTPVVRKLSPEEAIKKVVMERLKPLVGLNIEFVDDPHSANVRVDFGSGKGTWAFVGTDNLHEKYPKQTMNFAWLDVGTIIHEFCHVLGMIHEHQNPRGEPIDWNEQAVYKWAAETQGWDKSTTDNNIINKYDINQINGSAFDPLSIMLYFFPAFLTNDGKGTQQNLRLSGPDTLWVNKIYSKGAPETAQTFYPKVYNISLETALNESGISDERSGGKSIFSFHQKKNHIFWLIAVVVCILIIGLIFWLIRSGKKKPSYSYISKYSYF